MNKRKPESVLVVDDEDEHLEIAARILNDDGFDVVRMNSPFEAVDLMVRRKFDLVVTDLVMRGMHGFEVIKAALKSNPEAICVAMTSFSSLETAMEALQVGAYSFQEKPISPEQLLHCVHRGLEKQHLTKELRLRNEQLEKLNRELDANISEATEELRILNHRMLTEMASLKEVDLLKSAFLDNVTHDLRSPLTLIKGYIEHLLESSDLAGSKEVQLCFRSIQKASNHMQYLVSQLVDAARLTSGKIKLELAPVNIAEVLRDAETLSRKQTDTKKQSLAVSWEDGAAVAVQAERGRLLQILSNLLGNACKFTPENGRITLSARLEGSVVYFCVQDTGPGISKEHQKRIFDRFYQVDSSTTKDFKGLGLGLRIAKDLVLLHGGKIWLESEVGRGAKFHFLIPR